jgi:PIN domain nuclease of toxin-antitoxin system
MLLDTHVVLWLLTDDARIGPTARGQLAASPAVHVSAVSLWEIAIKRELGRLRVPDDLPERIEQAGLQWLPITPRHAWSVPQVDGLPHRDPFDRLLASQARVEGMPLLTADRALLAAEIPGVTTLEARR